MGFCAKVRSVVPDHLLEQLLVTWLSPAAAMQQAVAVRPEDSPQGCCRTKPDTSECHQRHSNERPPLQVRTQRKNTGQTTLRHM